MSYPPCGWGVEYAQHFLVCRINRLKECPDGSASTAWNYTGLLCNLHSLQSRLKRLWCWPTMLPPFLNIPCPISTQPLLPMMQHVDWVAPFPLVSISSSSPQILPYSPFTSLLYFPLLPAWELRDPDHHNHHNIITNFCLTYVRLFLKIF